MARRRRKRFNKKLLLILLSAFVVITVILGLLAWPRRHRIKDFVLRRDPSFYAERAAEAAKRRDYRQAEKDYAQAIGKSRSAVYCYDLARMELEWLKNKGQELNETERRGRLGAAVAALRQAVVRDAKYVDAQRLLTEIYHNYAQSTGKWLAYINEADKLLKLVPDDDGVYFRRALAWASLAREVPGENSENAIRDFEKAIELNPAEVGYWLSYNLFLQSEQRFDAAEEVFNRAVAANPDSPAIRVEFGKFLLWRNRRDECWQQIEEAVRRAPDQSLGYVALSEMYIQEKDYEEALKILEKAKTVDPSDYQVYHKLYALYRYQKEPEKALGYLKAGAEAIARRLQEAKDAGETSARIEHLQRNTLIMQSLLANAMLDLVEAGDPRADEYLQEARRILEEADWGQTYLKDKLRGRMAYCQGKPDEAIGPLSSAYAQAGTSDLELVKTLLRCYVQENLPGKAQDLLERLERTPGYQNQPWILLSKAMIAMYYRNFDEAQRLVEQALRIDPQEPNGLKLLATLRMLREGPSAVEGELSPTALALVLERASNLWVDGRRQEAVEMVESAYQQMPESLTLVGRLLWFYQMLGATDKAQALLERAKAEHPDKAAMLEMQEKLLKESDPAKRYQMRLEFADQQSDPFERAREKALVAQAYGDEQGYVEFLRQALEARPGEPFVLERLFKQAIDKQQWDQAEQYARQAAEANVDQVGGRLFLAHLEMARRRYTAAEEKLKEALAERPLLKQARFMLGQCYMELGRLDEAEVAFRNVCDSDPGYVPAVVAMARVTEMQGKLDEHDEWIERAYRLAPRNPYVEEKYLASVEADSKPEDIIAQRERILRQRPDDLLNRSRLALLYEKVGNLERAEAMLLSIYQDATNKLAGARLLANFYRRQALPSEAEKVMVEMIRSWPDKVGAYVLYAEFLSQYSTKQAVKAAEKAIAASPEDPRGHFVMANVLSIAKDWKNAAAAMERYLKLRPDDLGAKKRLVVLKTEAGDFQAAQDLLESILAENPGDLSVLVTKGFLLARQGDLDGAEAVFSEVLERDPNHVSALDYRAKVYLIQGDLFKARADLQAAHALTKDPEISMRLVATLQALGHAERAQMVAREILSRDATKGYRPAIDYLIEVYFQQKRWRRLADLLAQAQELFPDEERFWLEEARMYREMGQPMRAARRLEAAARQHPDSVETWKQYLEALLEARQYELLKELAGAYAEHEGKRTWVEAAEATALALTGQNDQADALFARLVAESGKQDLPFVVAQLQRAYGLEGAIGKLEAYGSPRRNDAQFQLYLGELYAAAGRDDDAVSALLKARDLSGDPALQAKINHALALNYHRRGRAKEAEQAYLACLKILPNDPTLLNNIAYLYADSLNQPDKALAYGQRAVRMAPNSASIIDTYGWTLAKAGRYAEACRYLARSVELEPANVEMRYHLGWAYEQANQPLEAERQYRQALRIIGENTDNPIHALLTQGLERVEEKLGT